MSRMERRGKVNGNPRAWREMGSLKESWAMNLADLPRSGSSRRLRKCNLVEDLWDEIAALPDDLPISPEEIALLDERLAAHRVAPGTALSLEEFKRQLAMRR